MKKSCWGCVFKNSAAIHEQHTRTYFPCELHLVRHHQHRHAVLRQGTDHFQHLADQLGIQCGGGLIEQHQHWPHRGGTGDRDTLLLAARQLRWTLCRVLRHAHPCKLFRSERARISKLHTKYTAWPDRHVVERAEMSEQIEPLEHHADPTALSRGVSGFVRYKPAVAAFAGHVGAVEHHLARGGDLDAVHAAQQRGFAGAARTDHHDDFARRHREIDAIDDGHVAEHFGQAMNRQQWLGCHASFFSTYSENQASTEIITR